MTNTAEISISIKCKWRPLRRLSEFSPDELKRRVIPSVYLWGFVHEQEFIPYYVGKANRPLERAMQHYSNLRGGLYPIYHRNSLAQFHLFKDDHKADMTAEEKLRSKEGELDRPEHSVNCERDQGMLYTPASPYVQWAHFMHPNVQREVAYLLDAFRFAYAEVSQDKSLPDLTPAEMPDLTPAEMIDLTERALADYFGNAFLQSTVWHPTQHCLLKHIGVSDGSEALCGLLGDSSFVCGQMAKPVRFRWPSMEWVEYCNQDSIDQSPKSTVGQKEV